MPGSGAAQGPCTLAVPLLRNTEHLPKGRLRSIKSARREGVIEPIKWSIRKWAAAFRDAMRVSRVPVIYNGDADVGDTLGDGLMVGRRFIIGLAMRTDARALLSEYIEASRRELCGDAPVLGRIKELLSYWCRDGKWRSLWPTVKICRSVSEVQSVLDM